MLELKAVSSAMLLLLVLATASASAQPMTTTINPSSAPITVYQLPEKVAVRPKVADQRLVNIAFGATANAGNTESYAGNIGGRLGLIDDIHQLTLEALGTMGAGRPRGEDGQKGKLDWTSRNVISRLRYDIFLSQMDALFVALAPRRDTFAGIKLRLQNQIGYLRNLYFPVDAHRLWSEVGYDFTYDLFGRPEGGVTVPASEADDVKETDFVHSARLFLGYTNRLSPTANLSLGVESLLEFESLFYGRSNNVRVNGLVELTSSITQTFKLGLQGRVLYDHVVPKGTEKADLIAAVLIVYTFDSLAGTLNPACPVCDCTAQVQAARNACRSLDPLGQITR